MKTKALKLISLAVTLVLLASALAIPTFANTDDTSVWDGTTTATDWETDGQTITISTAAQLVGFANAAKSNSYEGYTVYITKDIDLSAGTWVGIGTTSATFKANIEGRKNGVAEQSVTISGMKTNSANSGFIVRQTAGNVSYLNFEDCTVSNGGSGMNIGVVVGASTGGDITYSNISITNCTVTSTGVTGDSMCGVFMGQITAASGKKTFENITITDSTASSAGTRVGGLIGQSYAEVDMSNITINDTESGQGSSVTGMAYAGGLIGTATANVTMTDCNVSGLDITATRTTSGLVAAGALIGNNTNTSSVTISNTTVNGGTITVKMHGASAAIGVSQGDVNMLSVAIFDVTIVNGTPNTAAGRQLGGLIGRVEGNKAINLYSCSVIDCTITGYNGVGGLIGLTNDAGATVFVVGCRAKNTLTCENGAATGECFGTIDSTTNATIIGSVGTKNVGAGSATLYDIAPDMLDGASIRTTMGTNGLRFTSNVSADAKAKLDALVEAGTITSYTFGTVIALNTKINASNFTKAALDAAGVTAYDDIAADEGKDESEANGVTFRAALTGMTYGHKALEFAARSYVEITIEDETFRVYSDFSDENVRSMQTVAQGALADVSTDNTAEKNGYRYQFPVGDGTYSLYSATEREALELWK